ncbi:PIN domain-containing protein [Bacillus cereus]|uniref:PIN domain-containing protein n=1 Tax=Bacillus cereus TaxID=1396 RepID=UPI000BFBE4FF|nr:PIN domain-containing protein [Bacillus cereus]PGL32166.1 hypothetical protein CN913_27825 [Bacillus cereus]
MSLPYLHSLSNVTVNDSLLYTDTSFVWESFGTQGGSTPTRQGECHSFSTNAVQNGSVFIASPIIELELRNVAVKELLKHHAPLLGYKWFERKRIMSSVPNFMGQVHAQVDQIMSILSGDPSFIMLEKDASHALASQISTKYNMDLNDSIILATMEQNGINSIVTLDGDYVGVHDKNIQIYTNNHNYLKLLREYPNGVANNQGNNSGNTGTAS